MSVSFFDALQAFRGILALHRVATLLCDAASNTGSACIGQTERGAESARAKEQDRERTMCIRGVHVGEVTRVYVCTFVWRIQGRVPGGGRAGGGARLFSSEYVGQQRLGWQL